MNPEIARFRRELARDTAALASFLVVARDWELGNRVFAEIMNALGRVDDDAIAQDGPRLRRLLTLAGQLVPVAGNA